MDNTKKEEETKDVQEQMMEDLFGAWLALETAKVFVTASTITQYHHEKAGEPIAEKYAEAQSASQVLVQQATRDFDKVWRAIEVYMRRSALLIYSKDTSSAFAWLQAKVLGTVDVPAKPKKTQD